jgi:phosphoglycerol transferase MdoB-like AlkP superfamily enzyme
MCGNYPAPNSIIETRLNKPELCQSWNSRFIKEMNYDNYLAHTGTLQYDNMKSLFENIGYTNIYDKTNIDLNNRFKENDLSIDDLSMNFHFSNWLSNREKSSPFIASFITMNSHFPYWTPDKKFNISKNPYSNAMHYQDHFIGQVIKTLKQKKLYKNTIIIVTGDHGRRVSTSSQSIIPKSMYEVPLIIRLPQGAKREINYITNHAQIGGYLLEEVSGQPHGFTDMNLNIEKEHLIFFETDQIFYSLLSTEETSVLGPEGKIYSSSKGWPTFSSSKCDVKECPNNFNHYYTNLANLANWYDL